MPGAYAWKTYQEALAIREEYYSRQEFEDVTAYVRAQEKDKGQDDDDNEIKVSLNDALAGPEAQDQHAFALLEGNRPKEPLNIRPPHGSLKTQLFGAKTYDELERRWIRHARKLEQAQEGLEKEPVIKDDRGHRIYQATKDRKPFDDWRNRTRAFEKKSAKFANGS
jgi:hypothetical protein